MEHRIRVFLCYTGISVLYVLELYVLATSKVILGHVPTFDVHVDFIVLLDWATMLPVP